MRLNPSDCEIRTRIGRHQCFMSFTPITKTLFLWGPGIFFTEMQVLQAEQVGERTIRIAGIDFVFWPMDGEKDTSVLN